MESTNLDFRVVREDEERRRAVRIADNLLFNREEWNNDKVEYVIEKLTSFASGLNTEALYLGALKVKAETKVRLSYKSLFEWSL